MNEGELSHHPDTYHFNLCGERKTNFVVLVPANVVSCYFMSEYFATMCLTLDWLSPVMKDLFHI